MRGLFPNRDPVSAICLNISPGTCCKPHEGAILPAPETLYDYDSSYVSFTGLQVQQLGAGFAATSNDFEGIGCTGAPLIRLFGPSDEAQEIYHPDGRLPAPNTMVFAASWVDLRTRFPPDSAATRYLQWQGVKNMVWGSDTWSATSNGVPFPRTRKREREQVRVNRWSEKGQVTISTPRRWRYADLYEVNGTEFQTGEDGVFRSMDGRVFNLTTGEFG